MFRIYNPSFNLIKTGNLTKGLIDMSFVKKGGYLLEIQDEKTSFTHRLVKM
jgi:hypothetical protein